MPKFRLPVAWEMTGEVEVEAATLEEAVKNFDPKVHPLPEDGGDYTDDSFQLLTDDLDTIVAMTTPIEMYQPSLKGSQPT